MNSFWVTIHANRKNTVPRKTRFKFWKAMFHVLNQLTFNVEKLYNVEERCDSYKLRPLLVDERDRISRVITSPNYRKDSRQEKYCAQSPYGARALGSAWRVYVLSNGHNSESISNFDLKFSGNIPWEINIQTRQ